MDLGVDLAILGIVLALVLWAVPFDVVKKRWRALREEPAERPKMDRDLLAKLLQASYEGPELARELFYSPIAPSDVPIVHELNAALNSAAGRADQAA